MSFHPAPNLPTRLLSLADACFVMTTGHLVSTETIHAMLTTGRGLISRSALDWTKRVHQAKHHS